MGAAAVFFDAGETLVHPHPTFSELLTSVLRREGHEVDAEEVGQRSRIVFEGFARAARGKTLWTTSPERSRAFWHDVYRRFLEELGLAHPDGLIERIYTEFTDLRNYALFEDVIPALRELRAAGLRLGVISNYEAWLQELLVHLEVSDLFDLLVISGVEGVEKPDPAIFQLAIERAGVRADESVYVGDDPELDVVPARSVGMRAVLIDRRGRHPDAGGTRITSMAELPEVLGIAS